MDDDMKKMVKFTATELDLISKIVLIHRDKEIPVSDDAYHILWLKSEQKMCQIIFDKIMKMFDNQDYENPISVDIIEVYSDGTE